MPNMVSTRSSMVVIPKGSPYSLTIKLIDLRSLTIFCINSGNGLPSRTLKKSRFRSFNRVSRRPSAASLNNSSLRTKPIKSSSWLSKIGIRENLSEGSVGETSATVILADKVAITVRGVITSLAASPLKANSALMALASPESITPSLRPTIAKALKSSLERLASVPFGANQPVRLLAATTRGYITQITQRKIWPQTGANCWQYLAPRVLGIISEKIRIISVRTAEIIPK